MNLLLSRSLAAALFLLLACQEEAPVAEPAPEGPMTALPFETVPLTDLGAFKDPAANWQLAGGVFVDRKGRGETFEVNEGSGVLVNIPTAEARKDLYTNWEHGDIELQVEFMLPKNSNSGIYFQGRYELQILDSWGVKDPQHSDCGGIYERGEANQEGYEGHPPRLNASRAPGLWQSYHVVFRAPRFDAEGNKTENARFLKVLHNGVEIHSNLELSGPTRGSAFEDEQPMGPLRIQGDHGPVAFRRFGIKRYTNQAVQLQGLQYRVYELPSNTTADDSLPDFSQLTPIETQSTDSLSRLSIDVQKDFGVVWTGTLQTPTAGQHLFELRVQGGAQLWVDSQLVVDQNGEHEYFETVAYGDTELSAGAHTFELRFRKQHRFWKNGLDLWVEGPGMARHALHAPGSPFHLPPFEHLMEEVEEEAVVLRSYIFRQDFKHTHAASIGTPQEIHYNYDLEQASWLSAWSGDFVDVTAMWLGRGIEQVAVPAGARLEFSAAPSLARLPNERSPWPDSIRAESGIRFAGYRLLEGGLPAFQYRIGEARVADFFRPGEEERSLSRTVHAEGAQELRDLYLLLARGSSLSQLPNGIYQVDDLRYYLEMAPNSPTPFIRQTSQGAELLISLSQHPQIQYTVTW